jgi:hypothetical protein
VAIIFDWSQRNSGHDVSQVAPHSCQGTDQLQPLARVIFGATNPGLTVVSVPGRDRSPRPPTKAEAVRDGGMGTELVMSFGRVGLWRGTKITVCSIYALS